MIELLPKGFDFNHNLPELSYPIAIVLYFTVSKFYLKKGCSNDFAC